MQSFKIKKKEINIKNTNRLLIEDEVAPEVIQFVIQDASTIQNIDSLSFYLQYKNALGQYGIEYLEKSADGEDIVLTWNPSGVFTKENGRIELQIFGYTTSYRHTVDIEFLEGGEYYNGTTHEQITVYPADSANSPKVGDSISDYETEQGFLVVNRIVITRWSTVKTSITLPENIEPTDNPLIDKWNRGNLEDVMRIITE